MSVPVSVGVVGDTAEAGKMSMSVSIVYLYSTESYVISAALCVKMLRK